MPLAFTTTLPLVGCSGHGVGQRISVGIGHADGSRERPRRSRWEYPSSVFPLGRALGGVSEMTWTTPASGSVTYSSVPSGLHHGRWRSATADSTWRAWRRHRAGRPMTRRMRDTTGVVRYQDGASVPADGHTGRDATDLEMRLDDGAGTWCRSRSRVPSAVLTYELGVVRADRQSELVCPVVRPPSWRSSSRRRTPGLPWCRSPSRW